MEPNILKPFISFIVLLIITHRSVAKFVDFDSERLKMLAKQLYDKRIDFLGEVDTNYITDDDYMENPMKTRRLSRKTNISITGGPTVLSVGESTVLKCSSLGSPTPLIYWVRKEELSHFKEMMQRHPKMMNSRVSTSDNVGMTESKFVIDCASKQDEGEVFCISIIDEEILTTSVNITVNSSGTAGYSKKYCDEYQRPVIVDNLKFIFAKQGGTVSLPCGVRNFLKSNVEWLTRDGRRVVDASSNTHSQTWNGELVITDLNWNNMNEYICLAMSENGRDEAKTFVYPLLADDHKD